METVVTLNGRRIDPLQYPDGRNQFQVVDEVVEGFSDSKIVVLRGACGTGKSLIAILSAAEIDGKAVIWVPTKSLQEQYVRDYCGSMFSVGDPPLKITKIFGRGNFICPYIKGVGCDWNGLPCTRPLNRGETRERVASECPYWVKFRKGGGDFSYRGCDGSIWSFSRNILTTKCPYYKQYTAYLESDIIILNSTLARIESSIGRKPLASLEVVDEFDTWMDSLAKSIEFSYKTVMIHPPGRGDAEDEDLRELYEEKIELANSLDSVLKGEVDAEEWIKFYLNWLREVYGEYGDLKLYDEFEKLVFLLKEDAGRFYRDKEDRKLLYVIVRKDLAVEMILKRIPEKLLLMSATPIEKNVLSEVYGLDAVYVDGRRDQPGTCYLGGSFALSIRHGNWEIKEFKERYFMERDKLIQFAVDRGWNILVQPHARKYAEGLEKYMGDPGRLRRERGIIVVTTKARRGIDLPDENCRSIIILKYPFPDLSDPAIAVEKEEMGERFWIQYNDKARREFLQMIARGLRNDGDWIVLLSPDRRVGIEARKLAEKGVLKVKNISDSELKNL